MNNEEYECLVEIYSPWVKKLIDRNARFYRSSTTIKWCIDVFKDDSIVGTCRKKDGLVSINLLSILKAIRHNNSKEIEYLLLHEIRHAFQNEIIRDYLNGVEDSPIAVKLIEQWIYENDNYIKVKDNNGNVNKEYFYQDIEIDAFAYSYAVMKYKYNDKIKELYVPEYNTECFYQLVNDFIQTFEEEKIDHKDPILS